jgi:hypothetical protein
LFAFARLPSYVDLWLPFLAVLAGLAWAGEASWGGRAAPRWAAVALALACGLVANGGWARARAASYATDSRVVAARTLAAEATARDTVLADLGALVPDSLEHVRWNAWGEPPRTIYDETRTWGHDPVWTDDWYGGHRRLLFVNARWTPAESLLALRPRFVVTTEEWESNRAAEAKTARGAAPYDAALASGARGYRRIAVLRAGEGGVTAGPEIAIYRREGADPAASNGHN